MMTLGGEIVLRLTREQARVLFYHLRKPNKVDDYVEPLRDVREMLGLDLGLDPGHPKA